MKIIKYLLYMYCIGIVVFFFYGIFFHETYKYANSAYQYGEIFAYSLLWPGAISPTLGGIVKSIIQFIGVAIFIAIIYLFNRKG